MPTPSRPTRSPPCRSSRRRRRAPAKSLDNALGLLGIQYRFGGTTPASGFDCSGMVRYVFQNAIGLNLPRRAEEISRVGARVGRDDLQPGDLVFYKTLRRAISHVGIYLGDNRFIHAPSAGGRGARRRHERELLGTPLRRRPPRRLTGAWRLCGREPGRYTRAPHHATDHGNPRRDPTGEVAEWSNVPDSKSGVRASVPWVRIPPSPPA